MKSKDNNMIKWTLITGACNGIGKELALYLASLKEPLVIHYYSSQLKAEKLAQECRLLGATTEVIFGDFSHAEGVTSFIENYKSRYALTSKWAQCVGPFLLKPMLTTSSQELSFLFQTNVFATFEILKSLYESFTKTKGKIITFGCSGYDHPSTRLHSCGYGMSKSSLHFLIKHFALCLAPYESCINMISPGIGENSSSIDHLIPQLPMKRAVSLKEIVDLASFLLSDSNLSITGQNIEISGAFRL